MSKKLYFSSFAFLVLFAFIVANAKMTAPVHAQEAVSVPSIPDTNLVAPQAEIVNPSIVHTQSLSNLQTRGANLINARINSLNALKNKINGSKLTTTQKLSLTATINGRIDALNALATQIKQTTTVETARSLVQSIYSGYRIYAVVIPQINREMTLNSLTNHLNTLNTDTFAKVQARIDTEKAKNKNVTNWQNNLNTAKGMVAGVQSKIDATMQKVSALQPSDYPNNSKIIFADVKTSIDTIRKDILTIHRDLRMVK